MEVGYARVSTKLQNLDRQLDALKNYGIDKRNIYREKFTGTKKDRAEFTRMINELQTGDVVVVADLTRVSRSTKDLLKIIDEIKAKGASIKSIKDTWLDTTSNNPYNEFLLTIMAGLSQLERDLIVNRVNEGLEAARARGRKGGRPFINKENIERAIMLYDTNTLSVRDICTMCNIHRSTLYKYLSKRKGK